MTCPAGILIKYDDNKTTKTVSTTLKSLSNFLIQLNVFEEPKKDAWKKHFVCPVSLIFREISVMLSLFSPGFNSGPLGYKRTMTPNFTEFGYLTTFLKYSSPAVFAVMQQWAKESPKHNMLLNSASITNALEVVEGNGERTMTATLGL